MRYFLKRTNLKKGEYLQIYMSEYKRGIGSRNKSFKALGYTEELKGKGINDPVSHFQKEVDRMNSRLEKKEADERALKIGSESPVRYLGYFLLKGIANSLGFFEKAVDAIAQGRQFQFDVYDTMMALVYARAVLPASKKKTHEEVIPLTFEKIGSVSYQQVLACCEYIGQEYKKIACFLASSVKKVYGLDFKHSYFDCTNFYFEIDREDEWRKKGPSKENRRDPIISMGLLLDANQIPAGMSIFKGNESEKPQLRSVISGLKKENNISGRTIQVADKGLNCARNIHEALKNGDGYLFSKSLKKQSNEEIEWFFSLDKDTWTPVYAGDEKKKRKELEYLYYCFEDDFTYSYEDGYGSAAEFTAREKRVIAFSPKLHMKKTLEINRLVEKARHKCACQAKKDDLGECARFIKFIDGDGNKAKTVLDEEAIGRERKFAGYSMIVTSETKLSPVAIYKTYHNLWRIEQSFRLMKSYLDARPVYLTNINSIIGHFLICYIGLVLERILELDVLGSRFNHERIIDFIRSFKLVRMSSRDYVNLLTCDDQVGQFLEDTLLPEVTNYILSPADISSMLKVKLNKRLEDV